MVFPGRLPVLAIVLLSAQGLSRVSPPIGAWFPSASPVAVDAGQNVPPLIRGNLVERELSAGETHSYQVMLATNQYLRVVFDQSGIDVRLTLSDPGGHRVCSLSCRDNGPLSLSAIAKVSGFYRLELMSLEKGLGRGRYELKIEEIRLTTARDK